METRSIIARPVKASDLWQGRNQSAAHKGGEHAALKWPHKFHADGFMWCQR
jgi:hypothetical protein